MNPCRRELSRELDRLALVLEQLAEVEAERDAIVPNGAPGDQAIAMIAQLMRLKGVGQDTAIILTREVFYRDFAKRKAVAS